ncbi:hypothetical protein AVEN_6515-1 [Araneus ventricosus]|uniref:Uncharacterized protein n=1 Tax=Araneus ventricosus TaxID=182803 RepID=A0A4Y1ZSW3_ARAVE|nr:hypothetical protein AVEN_6515-1 [Araneus ventricosus]
MSTDTDIVMLNRKKGGIKAQLTKLHTFITQNENNSETVLITHLEILSRTSTKFEKLRNEFYRTVPDDDLEEEESSLSEIEDDIFQIEVSLKSLLHELRLNTSYSNSSDAKSIDKPQLYVVNDDSSPSINASSTPTGATPDPSSLSNVSPLTSCFITQKKRVILATAVVYVLDNSGSVRRGRTILDSGSMCNLMASDFANTLGLKKVKINIPVSGISDTAFNVKRKSTSTILNSDGSFFATLDFLVIPKITDLMPSTSIDFEEIKIPSYAKLADPNFFSPAKVDLLIAAELFFSILKGNRLCINNLSILQETVFGHVLSGTIEGKQEVQHCGLISHVESLDNLVKKFWEVENITDIPTSKNKEELECENHFMQTYRRDKYGKYIVSLPPKQNMQLGNSIEVAKQRLDSLWKRLNNDSSMAHLYCNFIKEYEELGHMQKIDNSDNLKHVMPHLGVYRVDSSTTKLRVVFDASAASISGVSLYNCLLKGGVVEDDLFSISL